MGAKAEDGEQLQFVRQKISLTTDHAEKLDTLAAEHHGGNRSQCVRRALDRYERSLEGESELTVKKVHSKTKQIKELVEQLEDQCATDDAVAPRGQETDTVEQQIKSDAHAVQEHLLQAEGVVTLADIVAQVEFPKRRVQYALAYLEDSDMVQREPTDVTYRLASKADA
jgi:predicted transcriptional regulator